MFEGAFEGLSSLLRGLSRGMLLVMGSSGRDNLRLPEGLVSCLHRPSPPYRGTHDVRTGAAEHFHRQARQ